MKVIRAGHLYELESLEGTNPQQIQFIEKMPKAQNKDELYTVNDGTTNEEVLAMMIDRLKTLGDKLPSRENSIAITKLEEALMWVEKRINARKVQGVYSTSLPHKS